MTRFLISFDDGAMDIPEGDLEAVGEAAHNVMRSAQAAGVWITGGGLMSQQALIVEVDGHTHPGPFPETKAVLGGFSIIDVETMEEACAWAARIARACRCPQEIRRIMDDPEV